MCVTFEDSIKSQARVKGRKPKTEVTLFFFVTALSAWTPQGTEKSCSFFLPLKELVLVKKKMPRPGPRPYECVRRAWHSDRHQPIRGSLIQEIFRYPPTAFFVCVCSYLIKGLSFFTDFGYVSCLDSSMRLIAQQLKRTRNGKRSSLLLS